MRSRSVIAGLLSAVALAAGLPLATHAEAPAQPEAQVPAERPLAPGATEGAPLFPPPVGQIFGAPSYRELLGPFGAIFGPPATRAPITLAPMLAVGLEYNDNLFFDNQNRRSDVIAVFTPGLTFQIQQPTYRLTAGYDFSAEVYARESQLNNVGDRQNLVIAAGWDVDPRLTLTLGNVFIRSYNTPRAAPEVLATGRQQFWTNTLSPGAAYRFTPRTSGRLVGGYTVTRVEDPVPATSDSESYRAGASVDHELTPRLTGIVGYQFGRFDFAVGPSVTTHTPRVGASYRVTPTLTASGSVGVTVSSRSGDTDATPVATAGLVQRLAFGSLAVSYDRSVGVPGTLGQTSETQTLGATLLVTTLLRGLTLALAPRYTMIDADTFDSNTFAVDLSANYQITTWLSAFASYAFLQQRADGPGVLRDVDQNRLFVGLQVRYPIDLR